jgi:hypothetical protein
LVVFGFFLVLFVLISFVSLEPIADSDLTSDIVDVSVWAGGVGGVVEGVSTEVVSTEGVPSSDLSSSVSSFSSSTSGTSSPTSVGVVNVRLVFLDDSSE